MACGRGPRVAWSRDVRGSRLHRKPARRTDTTGVRPRCASGHEAACVLRPHDGSHRVTCSVADAVGAGWRVFQTRVRNPPTGSQPRRKAVLHFRSKGPEKKARRGSQEDSNTTNVPRKRRAQLDARNIVPQVLARDPLGHLGQGYHTSKKGNQYRRRTTRGFSIVSPHDNREGEDGDQTASSGKRHTFKGNGARPSIRRHVPHHAPILPLDAAPGFVPRAPPPHRRRSCARRCS